MFQIEVNHGLPNSPFICIAQPKKSYDGQREKKNTKVILRDPKNGKETECIYFSHYEVNMVNLPEDNGLAYLTYGIPGEMLYKILLEKYPELNTYDAIVEFWILKRIKPN